MTTSIPSLLQPMKDRLAAATPGPWELVPEPKAGCFAVINRVVVNGDYTRRTNIMATFSGTPVLSIEDATLVVNAPTDQAKLIAAIEAIDSLADEFEESSEGFGLDLQDDDFERGWHGARRETVAMIRAALTQALGGDGA